MTETSLVVRRFDRRQPRDDGVRREHRAFALAALERHRDGRGVRAMRLDRERDFARGDRGGHRGRVRGPDRPPQRHVRGEF